MSPFVISLEWNSTSREELAEHGLTVADAEATLDTRPKFFPNKGNRERVRRGLRPRWMMIGPCDDGRLLTFIIEHPDDRRVAHLVTGWRSNSAQESRYAQPGGKRNRP